MIPEGKQAIKVLLCAALKTGRTGAQSGRLTPLITSWYESRSTWTCCGRPSRTECSSNQLSVNRRLPCTYIDFLKDQEFEALHLGRPTECVQNLMKPLQYVLSIPLTNAAIDRVFNVLTNLWLEEPTRLSVESIPSELLVFFRLTSSCQQFKDNTLEQTSIKATKNDSKYYK
ncbi:hypothetical protein RF11_09288 [Thelohanellus kitauei]|uniref:HAT C-terminal dimerisation domain-containing protein n=1 Tax=Thelohanellus kitauei TaxID=669202 RepID=A0A0C2J6T4_THEKT|nr:hypothetical protein RF11_09288 [Thelohanellus kitauei]